MHESFLTDHLVIYSRVCFKVGLACGWQVLVYYSMKIVFNAKSSQNKTNPTKEEIKPVLDLNGLNIAGVKTPWDSYASISGTFSSQNFKK